MDHAGPLMLAGLVVASAAYVGYRWWERKTGSLSMPMLEALQSAGEKGVTWTELRLRLQLSEKGLLTRQAAMILRRMCEAQVVEHHPSDPELYRVRGGVQIGFTDGGNTIIRVSRPH